MEKYYSVSMALLLPSLKAAILLREIGEYHVLSKAKWQFVEDQSHNFAVHKESMLLTLSLFFGEQVSLAYGNNLARVVYF